MKHWVLVGFLICNQAVYDQIYIAIVRTLMNSAMTVQDFKQKNDAIETLRKLCEGQRSSYETGK